MALLSITVWFLSIMTFFACPRSEICMLFSWGAGAFHYGFAAVQQRDVLNQPLRWLLKPRTLTAALAGNHLACLRPECTASSAGSIFLATMCYHTNKRAPEPGERNLPV